jgi:hypothetical protein
VRSGESARLLWADQCAGTRKHLLRPRAMGSEGRVSQRTEPSLCWRVIGVSRPIRQAAARRRFCRVCAARRAAARRTCGPFVRAARLAAALLEAADLRRAADLAWRARAFRDAAPRPSRFSAPTMARERRAEGRVCRPAARLAYSALRFVLAFAPVGGRRSFTPARRAFDRPIAMACFVDRAPCFPSRM